MTTTHPLSGGHAQLPQADATLDSQILTAFYSGQGEKICLENVVDHQSSNRSTNPSNSSGEK
jgi:hypothetical protein